MPKIFNIAISRWKLLLVAGDAACYFISIIFALYVNAVTARAPWRFLGEFSWHFILIGFTYFLVLFIADVYDYLQDYRRPLNIAKVYFSSWVGTAVVMIIFYFPLGSFVGRILLVIQAIAFATLLCTWRFTFSAFALPYRIQQRILIIGAGKSGQRLLHLIRESDGCGFLPVGFVDDDAARAGTMVEGLPVLGDSSRLNDLIKEHNVSLAAVAVTHAKSPNLINALIKASWNECHVMDMPSIFEAITGKLPTKHVSDDWFFQWHLVNSKIYYLRIKRIIDLMLAVLFLLISWPIFLLITLLIKICNPGPVFFVQERLGKDGRPFRIMKFRTMIQDAHNHGPLWTRNGDPRITRVGRIIRKLRLDELPQLLNIFKGEMSFIGPRPLVYTEMDNDIPYYNYRLLVKPGITGWAQVMYPDGLMQDTTPEKVKYDLYYIKNMGLLLDLAILLKTVRIVLFGRGN